MDIGNQSSLNNEKGYATNESGIALFNEKQERFIRRGFLLSMAETSLKSGLIDTKRYNQVVRAIEKKYGRV